VSITVKEAINVGDSESFPDVFGSESIKVTDAVTVTPLINVAAPVAFFSAGGLGFGNVAAGQTGTQALTLSEIGQAPLTISSAVLSQGSAFAVSQISCSNGATSLPTVLPVGGACAFVISYIAPSGAAANDRLNLTDSAALGNIPSVPSGSSYTQSIALNGSGGSTPPPPPPPAIIPIVDNEAIHVTDTSSFPDVFDSEKITVTGQVSVRVLNTTTISITVTGGTVYGAPTSAIVSVSSPTATVAGNVTLSFDGGTPATLSLSSGSATFNLGTLSVGPHALTANFAAQGNFLSSSAATKFAVAQATPTITWANPAPITFGTALSSTQLNARASVPGTFVYSPAAGTILNPGTQNLSVTFAPTNTRDYQTVTQTVSITVNLNGSLSIHPGQTYTFTNGSISGNVTLAGGTLILNGSTIGNNLTMSSGSLTLAGNSTISGSVQIQGGSFSIGPSTIKGNLLITNIPTGSSSGVICGARVNGNLQFQSNGIPGQIGPATCSGNTIAGNLLITGNTAALQIYKNTVGGNLQVQSNTGSAQVLNNTVQNLLQCSGNWSPFTGGKNTATSKQGQCSNF